VALFELVNEEFCGNLMDVEFFFDLELFNGVLMMVVLLLFEVFSLDSLISACRTSSAEIVIKSAYELFGVKFLEFLGVKSSANSLMVV